MALTYVAIDGPGMQRGLIRALILCVLLVGGVALTASMPKPAFADGPETVAQMERMWWSAGDQNNGVVYSNDAAWWNPGNWSVGGVDCSSYVGNVWQVRQISDVNEALPRNQDINTTNLRCSSDYWSSVTRNLASVAKGDAFVSDDDCSPTLEDHTFIYGWGDPCPDNCEFAVFEATGGSYNRVVHRSRTASSSYVVRRRQNIQEPGLIGRKDNNTNSGDLRQPIVDAFNRNGGYGNTGDIRWNGGGFLAHNWESGTIQDLEGGGGGAGGLMQPNSRSNRAYWVHGAIWSTYIGMGGAGSWLGYPLSDEYPWHSNCGEWTGMPATNFEGGYIAYDCSTSSWRAFGYSWLQNSSFSSGNPSYWNRLYSDSNWQVLPGGVDGGYYLTTNPGPRYSTSVYQDVPRPVAGNSYFGSVYLRCPTSNTYSCGVTFAVWGLEQDGGQNFSSSWTIPNDGAWYYKSVSGSFSSYHNKLRFEIYNNQPRELNIDAAYLGP